MYELLQLISVIYFIICHTNGEQMEVCPQLGCDFANKFSLSKYCSLICLCGLIHVHQYLYKSSTCIFNLKLF